MERNITKILIVDDEPSNVASIVDMLESFNWNLLIANNGKIAIEIAQSELPDIILMDWDMPIMNGLQATCEIRNNKTTAGIPIIIISGIMTKSENLYMALNSGAVDFVRKPFDKIELISRVKSMLLLASYYKEMVHYKSKELTSALLQLAQKNEFNSILISKLEQILSDWSNDKDVSSKKIVEILTDIKSQNKIIDWEKFNENFKETNPSFIKNLLETHPSLSPAELKLCALLRLSLQTKEIASISCQTTDSVRVSRTRLRKKLNLESEDNIVSYLLKF